MARNRQDRGFSLIELMVVISIITLLASVAYPKFISYRIKATRVEALMNLNHIYALRESFLANDPTTSASLTFVPITKGPVASMFTPNTIGFAVGDRNKLRYAYHHNGPTPHPVLGGPLGSFNIQAVAFQNAVFTFGAGAPVSTATCSSGGYYEKILLSVADRAQQIYVDALDDCVR